MTSVRRAIRRFVERPGLSSSYRATVSSLLARFEASVGEGLTVKALRAHHVDEFCRTMEVAGASETSLKTVTNILRAFYRYSGAPAREVGRMRKFRTKPKQKSYLRLDEIPKVLAACRGLEEEAVIRVLLSTGLRVAELCAMRRCDIEPDNWLRVPHGKGDQFRRTRISAKATDAVARYCGDLRKDSKERVFPFSTRQARRIVERVCRRVKLADRELRITPHSLRRTFGITLLKRGVGIYTIKGYYGHASISQTEHYLGMSSGDFVDDRYEKRTADLW